MCLPTLSYMGVMCELDSSGELVDLGVLVASQVRCKYHLLDPAICLLDYCTSMVSHLHHRLSSKPCRTFMFPSPFFLDCLFGQLQAKNQQEKCLYLAVNNMRGFLFSRMIMLKVLNFEGADMRICFYLQLFTDPSSII
jgi:hypothetical protein